MTWFKWLIIAIAIYVLLWVALYEVENRMLAERIFGSPLSPALRLSQFRKSERIFGITWFVFYPLNGSSGNTVGMIQA